MAAVAAAAARDGIVRRTARLARRPKREVVAMITVNVWILHYSKWKKARIGYEQSIEKFETIKAMSMHTDTFAWIYG